MVMLHSKGTRAQVSHALRDPLELHHHWAVSELLIFKNDALIEFGLEACSFVASESELKCEPSLVLPCVSLLKLNFELQPLLIVLFKCLIHGLCFNWKVRKVYHPLWFDLMIAKGTVWVVHVIIVLILLLFPEESGLDSSLTIHNVVIAPTLVKISTLVTEIGYAWSHLLL